jgi:hypothetical protein
MVLGWFYVRDASWILIAHRWLGMSTVTCSGLLLTLTAMRRRPERRLAQICFAVMLLLVAVLVLATGFFGGALVFGLDHYKLPE